MAIIDLHITIDAATIVKDYAIQPNPNSGSPVPIDHTKYEYMVVNSANSLSGEGTGTLSFKGAKGDKVRFTSASISNNYNNCVLLYDITPMNGSVNVFGSFTGDAFQRDNVYPSDESVLPAYIQPATFSFLQSTLNATGTEAFNVAFALYTRDANLNPKLYGYFTWDPTITVK